tara:strand:+ start:589 stop:801 length:213 start_codon:yes stop_codon:yes gene_type:complete
MEQPTLNQTPARQTVKKEKKCKKKKKKKKQSYKDMMAAITGSNKTIEQKIQEKKEALNTPSCEPPKLVTI